MQLWLRIFLGFLFLSNAFFAFAQDKPDTDDPATNYKTALSLINANKGKEGIPYLEKVIKTSSAYTAAAYSLLGGVYDNDYQSEKAIAVYKDALKAYPQDQSLHYNLGLAYFRGKQYGNAEAEAIEAIKLDPKHANSQRMYALVTFHQNKRVNALLGFCSFLLLEPNTPRSAEAYTNMQSILKGGTLKEDGTGILAAADIKERATLNAGLTVITTSAQAKKLTGNDLLEYELKAIFTLAGQLAEKKTDKTFFDKFYAAYFYKLAQSSNMPAFAKLVANKEMDAGLMDWVKGSERGF
ncbi:tetratricopeptide repeat protein [Mucilaginibacter sp.]|uniref:tetratricopeptide repeat protein n=1 Tax=Mucilaginibacter sp. TaxID=1882438 RepID=UPI00263777D3|nr:tetratricopeptide repeat protein [Mucilaginibacter sp.]MDB5032022.1 tetratricopeptide repeat protein [Mucilaginibacter sp.]